MKPGIRVCRQSELREELESILTRPFEDQKKILSSWVHPDNTLTALIEQGLPAIALLGTNKGVARKLDRYGEREFILCLDNDSAGQRTTAEINHRFPRVRVVFPPESFDDLGSWIEAAGAETVAQQLQKE